MQQEKVVEITLDSGIRVFVTPLSRYQRNGLIQAAEKLYPLPDKKQYEFTLSEDVAIPGMTLPADDKDNPRYAEYMALVTEASIQRQDYIIAGMLNMCLRYPDFTGKEALIEHFAPYLDEQRDWLALPEDSWDATLRFAIVRSQSDEAQILSIAKDEMPVTEAETTENLRVFRPVLSAEKSRILDYTRTHTPGAESKVRS
jgi:hypothetical protein